ERDQGRFSFRMHPPNVSTLYRAVANMTQTPSALAPAWFTERTVSAGGFEITYWEAGSGDPLVVLHGAGGPRITPAHERLAEHRRMLYVQIPGFGADPPNERSQKLEDLAETIAEAAQGMGAERYALLGTSFGGATAAWIALLHPDRVSELVLESPAA